MVMSNKKISIENHYLIYDEWGSRFSITLIDWVDDIKTLYVFEGYNLSETVINDIQNICKVYLGVIPVEEARKLWILLDEHCDHIIQKYTEQGKLWG